MPTWYTSGAARRGMSATAVAHAPKSEAPVAQFCTLTGAPTCNPILRDFAARGERTPVQNARLFARAYMAMADTLVAVFDAKHHYGFWRPPTAFRNGDIDGNDATAPDLAWTP
ncbi:hypothetical protein [Azohydromonas australica]|uniref:hypothetical protein n=1 Tax=Azohydromonas australica TaxID=364039 RepID=UPI0005BC06AC|nr:hypothetical protein [Azohydromonas australica]